MREVILLPIVVVGGLALAALLLVTLPLIGLMLWIGERAGYVRLGGWHQDDRG